MSKLSHGFYRARCCRHPSRAAKLTADLLAQRRAERVSTVVHEVVMLATTQACVHCASRERPPLCVLSSLAAFDSPF
jgi:hypothetical protein